MAEEESGTSGELDTATNAANTSPEALLVQTDAEAPPKPGDLDSHWSIQKGSSPAWDSVKLLDPKFADDDDCPTTKSGAKANAVCTFVVNTTTGEVCGEFLRLTYKKNTNKGTIKAKLAPLTNVVIQHHSAVHKDSKVSLAQKKRTLEADAKRAQAMHTSSTTQQSRGIKRSSSSVRAHVY